MNDSSASETSVLLTGATGVVGTALLGSLQSEVTCLTRSRSVGQRIGVKSVSGDVTKADLGLDRNTLVELTAGTDLVIHGAAITDYGKPREEFDRVNIEGTRNVVDFAARAEAPLYHLSTAAIHFGDEFAGTASNQTAEEFSPAKYVRSKARAEEIVLESGHPASIIRITWVLGDSRSGETSRFQGIHLLAQALLEGSLPMLPAHPEDRMDFLPQDLVADAIAFLVSQRLLPELCWLTAGEQAITVESGLEAIDAYAKRLGLEVQMPRMVDPSIVDRLFRPVFLDALPPSKQMWFEHMVGLAGSLPEPLPSSLGWLAEQGFDFELDPMATLATSLDYWGERRRIRQRVQVRQRLANESSTH